MAENGILVVEDEELVAGDIVRCLKRHGHAVCGVASTGVEAWEIALRERPALALMDIHLGDGEGGIETAVKLAEALGTPVIFLTGLAGRELFERAKRCKPLGYLIKPYLHEQLVTLVEIALENARLQMSLAASERQFRILAENSPDIILRMDGGGRFVYGNSGTSSLFGLAPEEMAGRTCRELGLPGPVVEFWEKLPADALRSGEPVERDFVLRMAGAERHFQVRAAAGPSGAPESPHVIATVRDATARRIQEQQLHEASQRLLYHANNSPLAVVEFDAGGHCLTWNNKAVEIFGPPANEGGPPIANCLPLIFPEDRKRFEESHELLRSGAQASAFVAARFIQANGTVAHGEWYLSALLDDEGECCSILCFLNDVSDREKAEQALLRANEEQEQIILNRTTMLRRINEDLHREIAARMDLERDLAGILEREHRRLGQDLHDGICQELAGIRFSVEAISKKLEKDSPARTQLESIAAAVQRSIHHTRLLSRGLAPLQLEGGDIASALDELAANTETLFQISCVFDCRGTVPKLDMDTSTHLYRIAQEAIQNAIKHGKASSIDILLDFTARESRMVVADNGSGLPPKKTLPQPGDGMGMKIMRHRAEILRGNISIHSPETGGTRVVCVFPK
jgi:PAS domain S-box-containing protein